MNKDKKTQNPRLIFYNVREVSYSTCGFSFKVITDFGKIWFKAIYVKETMASTKAFIV